MIRVEHFYVEINKNILLNTKKRYNILFSETIKYNCIKQKKIAYLNIYNFESFTSKNILIEIFFFKYYTNKQNVAMLTIPLS